MTIESGQKFNRLTALKGVYSKKPNEYKWLFRCGCGNEKIIRKSYVIKGITKSCGCLTKERLKNNPPKRKHGQTGNKVYYTWQAMKDRCLKASNQMFPNYGGRGIKVCDKWLESFENFLEDMGEPPSPKHSIDRIDNNGNYEPSNCRWATDKEQSRNKTNTKFVDYKGQEKPLLDWCDELNLSYQLMRGRLLTGWTAERAFTTPKVLPSFAHKINPRKIINLNRGENE
jgi:hypothetical protein